jgi:hypothetical protein
LIDYIKTVKQQHMAQPVNVNPSEGGNGVSFEKEWNISQGDVLDDFAVPLSGFNNWSASVLFIGCIGTGGVIDFQKANFPNGVGTSVGTIAAVVTGEDNLDDQTLGQRKYLIVSVGSLTMPTAGRIRIAINANT